MSALSVPAVAASLVVDVNDAAGAPLPDAVVYAEAASGQALPKVVHAAAEIEQRKRRFNPLVTAVQVGAEISFPNNDTVKHDVYSFSPAKVFDLPLYSGKTAPILFDKPGTVVLGCNIHDQMIAYIEVLDTPFFGKTDAQGKVKLESLPPGRYKLKAWHYNLPISVPFVVQDVTMIGGDSTAAFKLELKPGATAK